MSEMIERNSLSGGMVRECETTLSNPGHAKVTATHLKRNAFLYVRQSTLHQVLYRFHFLCVLYGQRGDRRYSVATVSRKRFQIRCHPGAATRIEPGNRQQDWWRIVVIAHRCSCLNPNRRKLPVTLL